MVTSRLTKVKFFPRPHEMHNVWGHGLETGVINRATIYPLVIQDEGLGDPASYESNPEHTSFASYTGPNCYPESRVNNVITELNFSLTKDALVTDNLNQIKCAFMPIFTSFETDLTASDELSGHNIKSLLELTSESTDRQAYGNNNTVKMIEPYTNSTLLGDDVPDLTTNQKMEGVPFTPGDYYDALQYFTNAGKLKAVQGGLKWFTLTKNKPFKKVKIRLRSKTKRMNPYTFAGVLCYVPEVGNANQYHVAADTTNVTHVRVEARVRFNEWNDQFSTSKI